MNRLSSLYKNNDEIWVQKFMSTRRNVDNTTSNPPNDDLQRPIFSSENLADPREEIMVEDQSVTTVTTANVTVTDKISSVVNERATVNEISMENSKIIQEETQTPYFLEKDRTVAEFSESVHREAEVMEVSMKFRWNFAVRPVVPRRNVISFE